MRVQQEYRFRHLSDGITFEDPIDFTDNGKCRDCGNCCGNIIPVAEKDVENIRKYIARHHIRPAKPLFLKGPYAMPTIHNDCPFLLDRDDHRCAIYEVRPAVCRMYTCHKNYRNDMDGKDLEILAAGGFELINRNMYATFYPKETKREMEACRKGIMNGI